MVIRRKFITLLIIFFIFCVNAQADSSSPATAQYNGTYNVGGITVIQPGSNNQGSISLHAGSGGLDPKASCGNLGSILGSMGLNGQSIDLNQLGTTALAGSLYFLGTSVPILREAIYGAKSLSNAEAQVGTASCAQAFGAIDKMNGQDSVIVRKCVQNTMKNGGVTNQAGMDAAITKCTNGGASLTDLLGDDSEVKKYLAPLDPRAFLRCQLGSVQSQAQVGRNGATSNVDANGNPINTPLTIAVDENGNATSDALKNLRTEDRVATLAVLFTPSVNASGSAGQYQLQTGQIDGKVVSFLQYLETFEKNVQSDLASVLNYLTTNGTSGMSPQDFATKYSINISQMQLLQQLISQISAAQTPSNAATNNISQTDIAKVSGPQCIAGMQVARDKIGKIVTQMAFNALKAGLLQTFADMLQQAQKIAAGTKNFTCANYGISNSSTPKPLTADTVKSIEITQHNIMDMLKAYEDSHKLDMQETRNNCKNIADQLRNCLGVGAGEWATIFGSIWLVGDDCDVFNSTPSSASPGNPLALSQNKTISPTPPTGFSAIAFHLTAYLLLVASIIYFAKAITRAALAQKWSDVAVHGFFILIIVSSMIFFIFKVGQ